MNESASTCTALKSAWVIIAAVVFTCLRDQPQDDADREQAEQRKIEAILGPCSIMNRSEGMMMP